MARINDIVRRVRAHPGIASSEVAKMAEDAFDFTVSQLMFPCLQELGETAGASRGKRHYTFTDPAVVQAVLSGTGTADLTALIATYGLLLENLKFGEIRHPDSPYPLVPVAHSGEGVLPSNYQETFIRYWLVGTVIHTKFKTDPLAGSLSFACPRVNGLDNLNPNLEGQLVDMLVSRLRSAPLKDAAPK